MAIHGNALFCCCAETGRTIHGHIERQEIFVFETIIGAHIGVQPVPFADTSTYLPQSRRSVLYAYEIIGGRVEPECKILFCLVLLEPYTQAGIQTMHAVESTLVFQTGVI